MYIRHRRRPALEATVEIALSVCSCWARVNVDAMVAPTLAASWLCCACLLHACCLPAPVGAGGFLENSADFILDAKTQTEQMNRLGSSVRMLSPRLAAGGTVARRELQDSTLAPISALAPSACCRKALVRLIHLATASVDTSFGLWACARSAVLCHLRSCVAGQMPRR